MRLVLIVLLSGLFFSGCSKKVYHYFTAPYIIPPGTAKVDSNLFVDQAELTNIGYKEFQYSQKSVYGKSSEQYRRTLLDTSVWAFNPDYHPLQGLYHKAMVYNYYPVVGIRFNQVSAYNEWRSDKVAEMLLIRADVIKPHYKTPKPEEVFTIDKLLSGEVTLEKPVKELCFPKYKVLTKETWERITTTPDSLIRSKDFRTLNSYTLENRDPETLFLPKEIRYPKDSIMHLVGNVSEIIEGGQVAGGHWLTSINGVDLKKYTSFETPNAWTGFRSQATYFCFNLETAE